MTEPKEPPKEPTEPEEEDRPLADYLQYFGWGSPKELPVVVEESETADDKEREEP